MRDKIAGKSLVIVRLGEKGGENPILKKLRTQTEMTIPLLVKERTKIGGECMYLQKDFGKLAP